MYCKIRQAKYEDMNQIFDILFDPRNTRDIWASKTNRNDFVELWSRWLTDRHVYICVNRVNTIIGMLNLRQEIHEKRKHVGVIGPVVVRHEFKRKGVATKLLKFAIEKSKEAGIKRLEARMSVDNAAVIALFQKNGFMEEGVQKKALRRIGETEFVDLVMMVRFFQ